MFASITINIEPCSEEMEEFHIEEAHRELVSTFRFTTYYEPLKRWPFTSDEGLRKRTKTHGDFPRLLLEQSATKGISRHKKVLLVFSMTISIRIFFKLKQCKMY